MRRVWLALSCVLLGSCTASPLACWVPGTCKSVCDTAARGGTGSALLTEECNCAIDCDLGVCSGSPICAP